MSLLEGEDLFNDWFYCNGALYLIVHGFEINRGTEGRKQIRRIVVLYSNRYLRLLYGL